MARFRLLASQHIESVPGRWPCIVYRVGDVVESDKDLVALCPNKFERLDDPVPAVEPKVAETPQSVPPPAVEAPTPSVAPARPQRYQGRQQRR